MNKNLLPAPEISLHRDRSAGTATETAIYCLFVQPQFQASSHFSYPRYRDRFTKGIWARSRLLSISTPFWYSLRADNELALRSFVISVGLSGASEPLFCCCSCDDIELAQDSCAMGLAETLPVQRFNPFSSCSCAEALDLTS